MSTYFYCSLSEIMFCSSPFLKKATNLQRILCFHLGAFVSTKGGCLFSPLSVSLFRSLSLSLSLTHTHTHHSTRTLEDNLTNCKGAQGQPHNHKDTGRQSHNAQGHSWTTSKHARALEGSLASTETLKDSVEDSLASATTLEGRFKDNEDSLMITRTLKDRFADNEDSLVAASMRVLEFCLRHFSLLSPVWVLWMKIVLDNIYRTCPVSTVTTLELLMRRRHANIVSAFAGGGNIFSYPASTTTHNHVGTMSSPLLHFFRSLL